MYNKDEIKKNLTIKDIALLLTEFGAEPQIQNDTIISKTICHNGVGQGSHKLYYYDNTKLFHCYTGCEEPSFDIFELVLKVMNSMKEQEYQLFHAIAFVAKYFGIVEDKEFQTQKQLEDWKILQHYEDIQQKDTFSTAATLPNYDKSILDNLPKPHILTWEHEGISAEVMKANDIAFDPVTCSIIIPHYDINNHLVGIRQRTLIVDEERYGKYRPAYLNGVIYKHPLSFNLYNINNSKDNIKKMQTVIVFESEKSPLLYQSYFGIENNISVAVCGFNLIKYQFQILKNLGVKEIVIAFDKQFKEVGDEEWKKLVDKYYMLNSKYGNSVKISFLFDDKDLLDYKDSPIDKGKDIFLQLFQERRMI